VTGQNRFNLVERIINSFYVYFIGFVEEDGKEM